tara:strand:- start:1508 stop:2017 length:510 start_codon:yes stop_codon:yes gene_type:complete
MRFLIIFIFLIENVLADDVSNIKNIVIHKVPKTYDNVIFLDKSDQKINIDQLRGHLVILNFWATWCEPCKEEMPSLDNLQTNKDLKKLKIYPINIGKEKLEKVDKFFINHNIKNLKPYFDSPTTLAKKFSLRGIPTSILLDKNGNEFARIIGSIDFEDKIFINWIKKYN